MSNTKLKPLYLLDIFKELTDEEHRITVPELVEELQRRGVRSERKGIYRDIDALIEYGAKIKKTGTGYYLAEREFSGDELKTVAWALKSAGFVSERRTARLLQKIGGLGGVYAGKRLMRAGMAAQKCENDELITAMDILDRAIGARRQVTFAYDKEKEPALRRCRVSPYGLVFIKGSCCLVCNVEGKEELSCLPVAYMKNIRADMTPWRHFSEVSEYRGELPLREFAEKAERSGFCPDA